MNLFPFTLEELPIFLLVILVSLSVHEWAHAWTAWKLGDNTAYSEGRVTLNPLRHLDLIGMLFLLVVGFGWAKPVPVRRSLLRQPRRLSSILVTAAGPFSNLVLAVVGMFVLHLLFHTGVIDVYTVNETVATFFNTWLRINLVLLVFNLIPLPPLDGYRILEEFASIRLRLWLQQREQWGVFVFLLLMFIPPLREVTIGPLFTLVPMLANWIDSLIAGLFGLFY